MTTPKESITMKSLRNGRAQVMALIVVCVALGAGFGATRNVAFSAVGVSAANHCTRYAPSISQDSNCTFSGTMYDSGVGIYETPSTALRDSNVLSLAASRHWELTYYGGTNPGASGTGMNASIGSSNGYARAQCWLWYQEPSVTGHCTTDWHD
jgi:hypothetical protein